MLKYTPAVFAVGSSYEIMVPVTEPSLFWVEIDGKCFYDEQNGIMRSLCTTHRVRVPADLLEQAKEYTVCERAMLDRKPYFPVTADTVKTTFSFQPLPENNIRIYHIADTHNKSQAPVSAAKKFGQIDLLVLNGDIPNDSGNIANFDTIYQIAEAVTGGRIPIVFARGNHDLRGYYAEQIADYIPAQNGNTYYSFRVGSVWGLVLDCGEDKDDTHPEYGLTVACHQFRERQTTFIEALIANSETEYAADGVKHKLIVSHNPFTYQLDPPFNIEKALYTRWAKLIKEHIVPDLMLCGHLHRTAVVEVGSEMDNLGQPCKMVIGSDVGSSNHIGCGIVLGERGNVQIDFFEGTEA